MEGDGRAARWRRVLERRLPVLSWARRYDRMTALADFVAGITLGLTLVPQSIAYATLADLPVQYGLYSAFMGTILYTFLGTIKEVSIGPTSLMALLTLHTCHNLSVEYMQLLTFLSGIIVTLMGIFRLGILVELISAPVTSGFTSGTAMIIVVSQLKGLLGLSFVAESVSENLRLIAAKWEHVRRADCLLGAVCIAVLLTLRKIKDIKISPKNRRLRKTVWLVSISRNAIVVITASVIAYCLHPSGVGDAFNHISNTTDTVSTPRANATEPIFKLSGRVHGGLPTLSLPAFSVYEGNTTVNFGGMTAKLGSSIILVPIVMVLANVAIAKAFSGSRPMDAMQEMVALGVCNVCGALVSAMPTCGAFTRSAVSHSSGVRTPAAGLYSGAISLLALAFLTEYFYFIPKATLSAVLICAVVFMIDVQTALKLWRQSRPDLAVLVLTCVVSVLWSVEMAVLVGALANVALLLWACARPCTETTRLKVCGGECVQVRPHAALLYLNAERFASVVALAADAAPALPVLVDCSRLQLLDYSASQVVKRMNESFAAREQRLVFYNVTSELAKKLDNVVCVVHATSAEEAFAPILPSETSHPEVSPLLA
ncbi:Sodium-independent sulfate anion transporter [Eumeta japonica]|uniref:Sodium-independent sulfate anion transporter n=1 Tax=Eumeta variegata TaxID=151549 RepID=A0A4C1X369_EUMVA|nr:Sodium-independent sulfate anion transporter [Eumeta japonica]